MRRLRSILTLATLAAVLVRVFGRRRDDANVRRLAQRLSSSEEDARRVYELSRAHGYGAAHETVFGRREPGRPPAEASTDPGQQDDVVPATADSATGASATREPVDGATVDAAAADGASVDGTSMDGAASPTPERETAST